MKNRFNTGQSGFTLIELMVTVGILSIIAAIAVPSYTGFMRSAYLAECAKEVGVLRLAQQEFFLENNAYFPNPAAVLDTTANTTAAFTAIEVASGNIYQSSYTTAVDVTAANCNYTVDSTAPAGGYTVTATGRNQLTAAESFSQTN